MNDASDRYILTFFCGAAVNGIYAVSYKIPTILSTLQSIFYNAWSVSAIKEFDKDDKDGFVGNIYTLYSSASLIGCSIILILNPVIARILYAKEFFEAWRYAPALLVGAVFNGLSLFEGCLFTAVKRTKDVSKTTLIGASVNTILNLILIPLIGAYGAAIATFCGYLTVWIVRTISLRKIIVMKVSWVVQILCMITIMIQGTLATIGGFVGFQTCLLIIMIFIQRKNLKRVIVKAIEFIKEHVMGGKAV